MRAAISAEAAKLLRHRATWFLIWIYPIVVTVAFLIAIAVALFGSEPASQGKPAALWIEESTLVWSIPKAASVLVGAYAALVFAGEYGWNTWKLVAPHRSRWKLMAAKYAVLLGLLYFAILLASVLLTFYLWVEDVVSGDTVPAGITFRGLVQAHWINFVGSLAPALWTVAYTSLAAVLTRSMLAALTISIVIDGVEEVFGGIAGELSRYAPDLVLFFYQALPGYHFENLMNWLIQGSALEREFPHGPIVAYAWATSLLIALAWILGIAALTISRFRRQDIN